MPALLGTGPVGESVEAKGMTFESLWEGFLNVLRWMLGWRNSSGLSSKTVIATKVLTTFATVVLDLNHDKVLSSSKFFRGGILTPRFVSWG